MSVPVQTYLSRELGGMRLAEIDYPPDLRQPRHAHGHATITLIVRGALEEQGPRCQRTAGVWSVVVKPADTAHADVFGPRGARTLQLRVPAAVLEREPAWAGAFDAYRWQDGGRVAACLARLYCALRGGEVSAELALDESLCQIAGLLGDGGRFGPLRQPPGWLSGVAEQLRAQVSNPPSVAALASAANVHPVYLARAFRRYYRTTMSQYVRRERVAHVCRRIATTSDSLASVALELGFADQPHLCRVFRAEMGMAPAAYRRLLSR